MKTALTTGTADQGCSCLAAPVPENAADSQPAEVEDLLGDSVEACVELATQPKANLGELVARTMRADISMMPRRSFSEGDVVAPVAAAR